MKRRRFVARRKLPGEMNSTERAYYDGYLLPLIKDGEYVRAEYEALTFRLAPKTTYTPDYFVVRADGGVEMHEVKGTFTREDARVKFKVAAEKFPEFVWKLVVLKGKKVIKTEER